MGFAKKHVLQKSRGHGRIKDIEETIMSQERRSIPSGGAGAVTQFVRTVRLVWRLLLDSRVPVLPKLIVLAAVIYVISPIDLIPDVILGLGQLDDIGVMLFAVKLFLELCPSAVVEEHRRSIAADSDDAPRDQGDIIDGSFRVIPDKDRHGSDR
jgi:uncharacterized membrane protein YkvA (DUF1232 family)